MEKLNTLNTVVNNTRTSINNKNVPMASSDGFLMQPDAVRAINFQDYSEELKPTIHGVNYYDYNGDLLYVYNVTDFLALTAHPSQPTHSELVADGWNWDLTDAQDFIQNTCDCLNIGGLYVTESGKTEIYFTSPFEGEVNYWQLQYRIKTLSGTGTLTIDWGDETISTVSITNTGYQNKVSSHTYENAGSYCIKVSGTENLVYGVSNTNSYEGMFGYGYTNSRWRNMCAEKLYLGTNAQITGCSPGYWSCFVSEIAVANSDYTNLEKSVVGNFAIMDKHLKGIVFPNGPTTIGGTAFQNCLNIKCICLSKTMGTTIGGNAFQYTHELDSLIIPANCTSLGTYVIASSNVRRVYLPNTITTIPNYCFNGDHRLEEVNIPESITSIGTSAFYECLSLNRLEFPSTVTSVGTNAFNYCVSLKTAIFHSTTPPTAGTTPFGNCPSLEGIYVSYSEDHSILTAYKEATNWSTYAAKIFELDENGNIPTE